MTERILSAMKLTQMESETDGKRGPILLALNPFSPLNYMTAGILIVWYLSHLKNVMKSLPTELHLIIMILAYIVIQVTIMTVFCRFIVPHLTKVPVAGLILSFICSI